MVDQSGLRIAMIIQSYLPRLGGAEKQLAAICRKLRQRNMDPIIITRRYKGMRAYELIDQTPVYRVPAPKPKLLAALSYLFFGLLRIHKEKPDVIHAHEMLSPTDMSILAKRMWHIPVAVKILRGGKLGDLDKLNHRLVGKLRIQRMKRNIDCFIAISDEIAGELKAEGISTRKQTFIPNGVDVEVYQPATMREKTRLRRILDLPQGFLCIYSGRLSPEKGLLTLIQAWKEIAGKHKDVHLLILGAGPMETELRSIAGENVHFYGYVSDPREFYRACDAFILPSETEGLSNAMLEAMACGLAVAASRVGAAEELIVDRDNGMLIRSGNTADIVAAVEFLLAHPEQRKRIGKKGVEKVRADYSLDTTVSQLVDLYVKLSEANQC